MSDSVPAILILGGILLAVVMVVGLTTSDRPMLPGDRQETTWPQSIMVIIFLAAGIALVVVVVRGLMIDANEPSCPPPEFVELELELQYGPIPNDPSDAFLEFRSMLYWETICTCNARLASRKNDTSYSDEYESCVLDVPAALHGVDRLRSHVYPLLPVEKHLERFRADGDLGPAPLPVRE